MGDVILKLFAIGYIFNIAIGLIIVSVEGKKYSDFLYLLIPLGFFIILFKNN